MQFSKVSLVICALAVSTAATIRADDNPAQAKAREALAAKLFEIGADEPVTNPPAAPTKAPVAAAAPMAGQSNEPVMTQVNADDAKAKAKADKAAAKAKAKAAAAQKAADEAAAKAKAKADADQAAADLKAKKAAAKKAADEKAAEIAAAKKQVKASMENPKPAEAAPMTMTSAPSATSEAPTTGDTPAQAKAREALAHSLFEESAGTPATPATPATTMTAPPMTPMTPAAPTTPAANPPMKPVMASGPIGMAPPLPISAEKQQKLADLLAKYRADQVTPEEYQKERADILAAP